MVGSRVQKKTFEVDRGIFLLRYESAEDDARPPRVTVHPDPKSSRDIELILDPETEAPVLWHPGTALVLRVAARATLHIEVEAAAPDGSVAAKIQFQKIKQGTRNSAPAQGGFDRSSRDGLPLRLDGFRLLGHVAGIGDVTVGADAWVAGPDAPSRIEGLAIDWPNKPDDVTIQYSVKTAGAQAGRSKSTPIGGFAGTRGRALPITGLVLEVGGTGTADLAFAAEALFLGSPVMRVAGPRLSLAGPTGREPLVGLRLTLVESGQTAARMPAPQSARRPAELPPVDPPPPAPRPVAPPPTPSTPPGGKIRVFRSAKQT